MRPSNFIINNYYAAGEPGALHAPGQGVVQAPQQSQGNPQPAPAFNGYQQHSGPAAPLPGQLPPHINAPNFGAYGFAGQHNHPLHGPGHLAPRISPATLPQGPANGVHGHVLAEVHGRAGRRRWRRLAHHPYYVGALALHHQLPFDEAPLTELAEAGGGPVDRAILLDASEARQRLNLPRHSNGGLPGPQFAALGGPVAIGGPAQPHESGVGLVPAQVQVAGGARPDQTAQPGPSTGARRDVEPATGNAGTDPVPQVLAEVSKVESPEKNVTEQPGPNQVGGLDVAAPGPRPGLRIRIKNGPASSERVKSFACPLCDFKGTSSAQLHKHLNGARASCLRLKIFLLKAEEAALTGQNQDLKQELRELADRLDEP